MKISKMTKDQIKKKLFALVEKGEHKSRYAADLRTRLAVLLSKK